MNSATESGLTTASCTIGLAQHGGAAGSLAGHSGRFRSAPANGPPPPSVRCRTTGTACTEWTLRTGVDGVWVPGLTRGEHLAAHGPLSGAPLYALAAGSAAALAAVHAAGVVHRDVKPGNVILAPDGPQMVDFGIAHALDATSVTRTGVMTGTTGWISPEGYRTGAVGPAGDVFCWEALVAYAATGRLPFGTGAPGDWPGAVLRVGRSRGGRDAPKCF
jgi:hypothetical protein